ncbi:TPA: hypothetical protein VCA30_000999 [Bacillus cereus]|uniref:hypothetical protein n=1 Tax=Bacillus cereus group TaxID=86661 RepID=UPI000A302FF1|nr:hypothetical protein [Bacillus cereus]HDX9574507.1 hypothetical protein [Bacillus mobilis]MBL3739066.1 hypothetical protein [Bacillus cereus]MBL3861868.1 hypothetical protein [Bacillus cereus]MDG1600478.1 hypothetical protein [Bacillus cereus]SMD84866.1 hypothetical protein BACERE00184_01795 [Bacillus cereus]
MLVHRDCIFYKYTGTPEWKEIELGRGESFSSFKCELYETDVIKAKFQWVDPIKVRDKIITTERKTIDFLIFEDINVVCIFGGSESHIAYTISKISQVFPIVLKKVDLFEKYKEYVINNKQNGFFKLQSIDVSKEPTGYDSDEYINISTKEIELDILKEYIESDKLVSFVISIESIQLYFFLDYMSVVSFMDTDEVASILNACKRIVKYIA